MHVKAARKMLVKLIVSITSLFYEQLLQQQSYYDLTGALRRVSNVKVWHNLYLSVLVNLGIVLVVK